MASGEVEVGVIGGGAAGIAAARVLHDAGVACLLVEARPRLGGRAWTVTDPGGLALDAGCGWLHSADRNPWAAIARQQGRVLDDTPPPWGRPSLPIGFAAGEQRDYLAARDQFDDRIGAAHERPDAPASAFLEPGCRWNPLITAVNTYVTGSELDRVSAHDLASYEDSGVNWRVGDGYGATIAAHGAGLPVALDCPVQRIDHSGPRLRIETSRGTIVANRIIVTLPAGVLAANEDLFTPVLPDKTQAALGLPMGLADKLFLSLEHAEEFEADSRLFGRTDRVATATYHMRPFGRPYIECYFGGSHAAALERGGTAAFIDFAVSELTSLLGSAFARRVVVLGLHSWGVDPFARGSYSYASPGQAACRGMLADPVDGRIFFAGEACSPGSYSTAHGAYLTGVAASEAVLAARA